MASPFNSNVNDESQPIGLGIYIPAKAWPALPPSLVATERVHIRFNNSDRLHTITEQQPAIPLTPLGPEHGAIAQRRVQAQDECRESHFAGCYAYEQVSHPERRRPDWSDVQWADPPHPGTKVITFATVDGQVSPMTANDPPIVRSPYPERPRRRRTLPAKVIARLQFWKLRWP
jgi:hypothetical protein